MPQFSLTRPVVRRSLATYADQRTIDRIDAIVKVHNENEAMPTNRSQVTWRLILEALDARDRLIADLSIAAPSNTHTHEGEEDNGL